MTYAYCVPKITSCNIGKMQSMSKITVIYDSYSLMYVSVPGSTITYDSTINTRRLTRPSHYAL